VLIDKFVGDPLCCAQIPAAAIQEK